MNKSKQLIITIICLFIGFFIQKVKCENFIDNVGMAQDIEPLEESSWKKGLIESSMFFGGIGGNYFNRWIFDEKREGNNGLETNKFLKNLKMDETSAFARGSDNILKEAFKIFLKRRYLIDDELSRKLDLIFEEGRQVSFLAMGQRWQKRLHEDFINKNLNEMEDHNFLNESVCFDLKNFNEEIIKNRFINILHTDISLLYTIFGYFLGDLGFNIGKFLLSFLPGSVFFTAPLISYLFVLYKNFPNYTHNENDLISNIKYVGPYGGTLLNCGFNNRFCDFSEDKNSNDEKNEKRFSIEKSDIFRILYLNFGYLFSDSTSAEKGLDQFFRRVAFSLGKDWVNFVSDSFIKHEFESLNKLISTVNKDNLKNFKKNFLYESQKLGFDQENGEAVFLLLQELLNFEWEVNDIVKLIIFIKNFKKCEWKDKDTESIMQLGWFFDKSNQNQKEFILNQIDKKIKETNNSSFSLGLDILIWYKILPISFKFLIILLYSYPYNFEHFYNDLGYSMKYNGPYGGTITIDDWNKFNNNYKTL